MAAGLLDPDWSNLRYFLPLPAARNPNSTWTPVSKNRRPPAARQASGW